MARLFFFFALFCSFSAFGQTVFVRQNAAGTNDGTSWASAYPTLDAALQNAAAGNQVWVAAWTHQPAGTLFLMAAGVELYGGFAGTETTLAARNPVLNITRLSGEILGDDIANAL